jgi:hypothetical protein
MKVIAENLAVNAVVPSDDDDLHLKERPDE